MIDIFNFEYYFFNFQWYKSDDISFYNFQCDLLNGDFKYEYIDIIGKLNEFFY